jgi:hypothetical protein
MEGRLLEVSRPASERNQQATLFKDSQVGEFLERKRKRDVSCDASETKETLSHTHVEFELHATSGTERKQGDGRLDGSIRDPPGLPIRPIDRLGENEAASDEEDLGDDRDDD